MAYIGQSPVDTFSPVPSKDSFTGDGSTTTFDLQNAVVNGGENALEVFVNNVLSQNHFSAQLITISPQKANSDMESGIKAGDFFIGIEQIKDKITPNIQSLILRTQSSYNQLNDKNYNNTNWPYLSQETATYIRDFGIVHLLIDQPSVDKEFDGGKLLAHKAFWNYPNELDKKRTITELIGIPDEIIDGIYLLNLSMANIENDASPSRPTIYELF